MERPYHSPPSLAWIATHREIVRRGKRMAPALMKMLETEAVRNPGEVTYVTAKFGFAVDVMRMLGEIGDPRSVPLLVRVIDGMDGKANLPVRLEAMKTAATLTYVAFLVERDNPDDAICDDGRRGIDISFQDRRQEPDVRLRKVAGLYAKWLGNEGRDPARWLASARVLARKALEGNDPIAIRNAVGFLPDGDCGKGHDDRPEQTMRVIAEIMTRSDQTVFKEWQFGPSFPVSWRATVQRRGRT